ncbi:Ada metal-binding domain-containing protein [Marinoscillum sp.]|uniref:Ada metal-binding domain-containing protein n=1 Tax=Marinoscillum sp. TaxID=2024838 RepID=UPI003BAB798D
MWMHENLDSQELLVLLKNRAITLAGNSNLKIYGMLACKSGRRMYKANRVFFTNETEAVDQGYRPCGHCMKTAYELWNSSIDQ